MRHFSSWRQFEAWLEGIGLFHMELGLERMEKALDILQLGQLPYKTVQILGTNGKGSTSAFLESLARAHGLKTGLYTSPHFISPKERALVNGKQAPDGLWLRCANEMLASPAGDLGLTYFEFLTLLSLRLFQLEKVEIAILEAGLGGANDATSAIGMDARCMAPIAMDHAAIIGPRLEDIATDKAGAIKNAAPIFSSPQFPIAEKILRAAAAGMGAPLNFIEPISIETSLGLAGAHQFSNAATALAAWRHMAPLLNRNSKDNEKTAKALSDAFLPGRLQKIPAGSGHPALILDGAHNPHGARALRAWLDSAGIKPAGLVFSCLGDKDWRPGLEMLCRNMENKRAWIIQLENHRAAPAGEIAAICRGAGMDAAIFKGKEALAKALEAAKEQATVGPVLLAGSLYLLAEFFKLYPKRLACHPSLAKMRGRAWERSGGRI